MINFIASVGETPFYADSLVGTYSKFYKFQHFNLFEFLISTFKNKLLLFGSCSVADTQGGGLSILVAPFLHFNPYFV